MATSDSNVIQLPLPIAGEVIKIPLFGGLFTLVDAIDADTALIRWSASQKRGRTYAQRTNWKTKKREQLHRIVLSRMLGRELNSKEYVDHIDNDALNNRRENLRLCTNKENIRNGGMRKNNTSGYKGVSRKGAKWEACICVDRKTIHLGSYETPEQAHRVYCEAAKKYFGEFARFE